MPRIPAATKRSDRSQTTASAFSTAQSFPAALSPRCILVSCVITIFSYIYAKSH